MNATPALLEARDLTKHFGGHRLGFSRAPTVYAVNGVSFAVQAGETFAIVGESGCGKSTLGRLLLRLLDATRGEVRYRGEDIMKLDARAMRRLRRELQIIFQDPFASLNPSMTVGGLIGEPIALHGLARGRARDERVAELLRTVGLQPDYAQRFPHEFSGGQRQRIGIARALAGEPPGPAARARAAGRRVAEPHGASARMPLSPALPSCARRLPRTGADSRSAVRWPAGRLSLLARDSERGREPGARRAAEREAQCAPGALPGAAAARRPCGLSWRHRIRNARNPRTHT